MKMKNILTRAMALILTGAACIGGLHTEASAMTACQTYYKELFPQDFGTMFPDADDKNSPGADRFRAWMKENNKEATLVWLKKYCGEPIYTSDDGVSYYYYPGNAEEESFYIGYMGERNFQYDGQKLMFSPVDYGKKLILGKGETITLGTNYNYNKTQEYQYSMGENGSHVTAVSDGNVVYSSSNEKVATVDGKGKVKAKKKGKTTITASVTNEKYLSKVDRSELKYFTISVDIEVRNKPKKSETLSYGMKYCKKETKDLAKVAAYRSKDMCKVPGVNGDKDRPYSTTKAFKDGCRDAGKYAEKLFDKWKSGMITTKEAKKLVEAVKVWMLEDKFYSEGKTGRDLNFAGFKRGTFTRTFSIKNVDWNKIMKLPEGVRWTPGFSKVYGYGFWKDKTSVYYDKKEHHYRVFTGGTSYYDGSIDADDYYFGCYVFPNGKRMYESSSSGWRKTGDEGANTITIINKDGTIKDIINISFGAIGESFMNLNSRGEGWGAFSLYADELDDYGLGFLRR